MWKRVKAVLTRDLFGAKEPIEYLEPTPESRRKTIKTLIVGLVVGLPAILAWKWFLSVFLKSLPICEQIPWLQGVMIVSMFTPAVLAAAFLPRAIKMLSADQWPPQTIARYRRVRLWRGRALRIRGGLLLAWCMVCLPFPLYYVYPMMKYTPVFDGDAADKCRQIEAEKQKKMNPRVRGNEVGKKQP